VLVDPTVVRTSGWLSASLYLRVVDLELAARQVAGPQYKTPEGLHCEIFDRNLRRPAYFLPAQREGGLEFFLVDFHRA